MALNPPISMDGLPISVDGEYLVLKRKDIEVEFRVPDMGKYTGKGNLFITTARMVFVDKDFQKNPFKSFDIPLLHIREEKFNQPIFGSNNISGVVKPLYNLLPADTKFKLWFTAGGCSKFVQHFGQVLGQIRRSNGRDQTFAENVRKGNYGKNEAFYDPSDPTTMFIEQPQNNGFQNNIQNNQFFGNADMYNQFSQQNTFQGQGIQVGSAQTNFSNNQQNPQYQQQQQQQPWNNFQQPQNQQQPQQNFDYPEFGDNSPQTNQQQNFQAYHQQQFQPNTNDNFQQPQNQMQNPQQQQMQQFNVQQQPQTNVGYYYGWFGPQLQRN